MDIILATVLVPVSETEANDSRHEAEAEAEAETEDPMRGNANGAEGDPFNENDNENNRLEAEYNYIREENSEFIINQSGTHFLFQTKKRGHNIFFQNRAGAHRLMHFI